jgi:hypothetical protein
MGRSGTAQRMPDEELEQAASGWANVVAIDPGGTTGWSVFMVHPDALSDEDVSVLSNVEHWSHGQIHGDEDSQAKQIMELIEAWPDCAVVMEDFILRTYRKDRDLLAPVRIAAKVEFGLKFWPGLGGQRNNTRMFYQPTSVLASITDSRLQQWGFYQREGGMEHARDADRHALYFLRGAKVKRALREAAWPDLYLDDEALEEAYPT